MADKTSPDPVTPPGWDRVSAELSAYREEQQRTWGTVEPTVLGRYLADETNPDERRQVENALEEHPELRKLTDLVRAVLADFEPDLATPAPIAAPEPVPVTLAFRPQSKTRSWFTAQHAAALALAACLFLTVGIAALFRTQTPSLPNERQVASTTERRPALDSPAEAQLGQPGPLAPDPLSPVDGKVMELAQAGKVEDVAEKYQEVARREKMENDPRYAERLALVGTLYEKKGLFDQAAPTYEQAHTICQNNRLDAQNPVAKRALNNLANLYQVALNTPESDAVVHKSSMPPPGPEREAWWKPFGAPSAPALPPQAPAIVAARFPDADKGLHKEGDRRAAVALRDRITKQEPGEVQRTVVPVLAQALHQAPATQDRIAYIRALGQLGPAAKVALPALVERLRNPGDVQEQLEILLALGQVGPAAPEQVLPILLEKLRQTDNDRVRDFAGKAILQLGPLGRSALQNLAKAESASDRKVSQWLLNRVQNWETRVGVCDGGQAFTPYALNQTRGEFAALARQSQIEVYAETVPASGAVVPKRAEEQARLVGTQGVYLLLFREPRRVEVHVADALRKQGFTPERVAELKARVEQHWKSGDADKALDQIGSYLGEFDRKAKE